MGSSTCSHLLAEIISPSNNSLIIGPSINVEFVFYNASDLYFQFNGQQYQLADNSTELEYISGVNQVQLSLGYGSGNLCLISTDMNTSVYSNCIFVTTVNPNLDSDSDGVPDYQDQCPSTVFGESPNAQGCSNSDFDEDSDGVPDFQDLCADTNINQIPNSQGCSLAQIDTDNDGVMDDIDICQGTIAGSVVDSLGCSSSQRDSDSDGVTDNFDQCPKHSCKYNN